MNDGNAEILIDELFDDFAAALEVADLPRESLIDVDSADSGSTP